MKTMLLFAAVLVFATRLLDQKLDDALTASDWEGVENILKLCTENKVDACKYFDHAEKKFHSSLIQDRLLLLRADHYCPENKKKVEEFLKHDDPVLRGAALRLAGKLPEDERRKLIPAVQGLEKTEKDPLVRTTLREFLNQ